MRLTANLLPSCIHSLRNGKREHLLPSPVTQSSWFCCYSSEKGRVCIRNRCRNISPDIRNKLYIKLNWLLQIWVFKLCGKNKIIKLRLNVSLSDIISSRSSLLQVGLWILLLYIAAVNDWCFTIIYHYIFTIGIFTILFTILLKMQSRLYIYWITFFIILSRGNKREKMIKITNCP